MKTLTLLFIIALSGHISFAQNVKCLALSEKIVSNTQGIILSQAVDYNEIYFIKATFPKTYNFEAIKTICDTTVKNPKISFNWRLNYDKNYEKEYVVGGKKLLITIYERDKFLYFEFPNE